MRKRITLIALVSVIVLIVAQSLNQKIYSDRSGAPSGRTGSPFDNNGVACNYCHVGSSAVPETGWITSTIPGTGYVPGSTYTITGTATSGNLVRFGFEISPQTSTGVYAGTNQLTNTTRTKFASNNQKYVTHTTTGSDAASTPGTSTWSFNWVAPIAGTGTVTFYGAFNCTNNSNSNAGDVVHTSQLVVQEDISTSMTKAENNSYSFDAFPNPSSGTINISVNANQPMLYHARLMDVAGKEAKSFETVNVSTSISHTSLLNLDGVTPGIYFLQIVSESSVATKKIVVL